MTKTIMILAINIMKVMVITTMAMILMGKGRSILIYLV